MRFIVQYVDQDGIVQRIKCETEYEVIKLYDKLKQNEQIRALIILSR